MTLLVNAKQMRECDRYTIETIGIPSLVLMEKAALAVVAEVQKPDYDLSQVLVVCGSGNNGGDGLAIARLLHLAGHPVTIFLASEEAKFTPETKKQFAICQYYQLPVLQSLPSTLGYTLIIDSFLGIGAHDSLTDEAFAVIQQMNQAGIPIVAVDVPSGIDASTGESLGTFVTAQTTVTFQFKKIGATVSPGSEAMGKLIIADIGISDAPLN